MGFFFYVYNLIICIFLKQYLKKIFFQFFNFIFLKELTKNLIILTKLNEISKKNKYKKKQI